MTRACLPPQSCSSPSAQGERPAPCPPLLPCPRTAGDLRAWRGLWQPLRDPCPRSTGRRVRGVWPQQSRHSPGSLPVPHHRSSGRGGKCAGIRKSYTCLDLLRAAGKPTEIKYWLITCLSQDKENINQNQSAPG